MEREIIEGVELQTWIAEEVAEAWERDEIVLIDVRTIQEYAFEHIGGALLLPMSFFEARRLPGQSDKRIVFHCGSGIRSEKVARACIAAGMAPIAHMGGGFAAWKAAKLPFITTNMKTGGPHMMNVGT